MTAAETPIRFDFDIQILGTDEATGLVEFALRLSPDRYQEAVLDDGTQAWYDRFDDLYISDSALADLAEHVAGLPLGFQPQRAGPLDEYLEECRARIQAALTGGSRSSIEFADVSEDWLRSRADDQLGFAVLSVDLVDSTTLAQTLSRQEYARLQVILQDELSELVPLFGGHVLKYTGDGLLAYFPEPSFIVQNDLACECALYMRAVVNRAINQSLQQAGLSVVQIRIGIDAGEAAVVVLGSPRTKRHADLIGDVIGLACKVEKHAEPGGIAIGSVCWRSLHTSWREHCRRLMTPPDWTYRDIDGKPYPLLALDPHAIEQRALGSLKA
jgi:class 3 adenylate cyclase